MKTILIGNGFNIEIGGKEYLNRSIINRALNNVENFDYATDLFESQLTNGELKIIFPGMYEELKSILNGKYDEAITDHEDKELITVLKSRYDIQTVKIDDIGMEDFFVVVRLFHKLYGDDETTIKSTHDGFSWIFLDAIYNEGKIQNLYNQMPQEKKDICQRRLSEFDSIYTTNYDCNIEKLSQRNVYYLHGNFSTLLDQYDPSTLMGYCYSKRGNDNPVNENNRHIYSNSLMGFSGIYKQRIMDLLENGQKGAEYVLELLKNNEQDYSEQLERLKTSEKDEERMTYDMILALQEDPELRVSRYPMTEFKQIEGELYLLGISVSNDEHIWKAILENSALTRIVFYYHREESKQRMQEMFPDPRLEYESEKAFWNVD